MANETRTWAARSGRSRIEYVQAEAEDICDTAEDSDGRNDQVDDTAAEGQVLAAVRSQDVSARQTHKLSESSIV